MKLLVTSVSDSPIGGIGAKSLYFGRASEVVYFHICVKVEVTIAGDAFLHRGNTGSTGPPSRNGAQVFDPLHQNFLSKQHND